MSAVHENQMSRTELLVEKSIRPFQSLCSDWTTVVDSQVVAGLAGEKRDLTGAAQDGVDVIGEPSRIAGVAERQACSGQSHANSLIV